MPRVAVMGGSLGGLTAALFLHDIGCEVQVYERSRSALEARGAGIAVLDQTLRYPVERLGVAPESFCSTTEWIRFLAPDGEIQHEQRHLYRFTSWNALYRTLVGALEPERYRLGHEVAAFSTEGEEVALGFSDGSRTQADLLVCADGINSTARQQLLPQVAPRYAGYVAWRGTVPEAALCRPTYEALHDALTYQLLPNSHILVYPIPGLDGSVEPGRRLMNVVWYRNVAEDDELPALLTDRTGNRRPVSLPPGTVPDQLITAMRSFARTHLAPPIAEVVTALPEPFVQAVFDTDVPRMVVGRCCLIGDAAFAVRPHAAAGTAKAAEDSWMLAQELRATDGCVPVALERWEAKQLSLGRTLLARTREIGDSSQFTGGFRPGDPRLIFGLYAPGR
jgi:2,6-dihydroxypyridine 3-monooxygenase